MMDSAPSHLDRVFGALADPTRRGILAQLAGGEASVSELAAPLAISLPAVTRHLSVLERAGLIESQKVGRVRTCRLQAAPLEEARDWIERYESFWRRQLDSLADLLEGRRPS